MLSEIFQTQQSYSCGTLDERSFEKSAEQSVFFYGNEEAEELDIDMDSIGCDISFFGDDKAHSGCVSLDYTPESLSYGNETSKKSDLIESGTKGTDPFSSSFEILKEYGSRCRKLNGEKMNFSQTEPGVTLGLSIETIIQLAADKFIKSSSQTNNEFSTLSHPYPSSLLCHSKEDFEGVHLVQNLLSCAEKVDKKRHEQARELLLECDRMSSPGGTPVQRLVFYFAEALYEKIDRETGGATPRVSRNKVGDRIVALNSPDDICVTFHKELPISQITKFAGIQAVVDNIGEARKVHFIDLEMRRGVHCTILMQALASITAHPIERLKITALGTTSSKGSVEETGRRLTSFAQSLGLQFSFHVVMVNDILDLSKSSFDLDADEDIAVYAEYTLTFMIGKPDRLAHMMSVMRSLNPCVMVVAEVEANCNSPIFVDRFVESLVYFGAFFESMGECLKNDEKNRYIFESTTFGPSIRNIVATEGEERKIRPVRIDVWRSFFMRLGFQETELSMSSVYQANLVLKTFSSGNSYTFGINGKSLIIGWKGIPLGSLSAWKLRCP